MDDIASAIHHTILAAMSEINQQLMAAIKAELKKQGYEWDDLTLKYNPSNAADGTWVTVIAKDKELFRVTQPVIYEEGRNRYTYRLIIEKIAK